MNVLDAIRTQISSVNLAENKNRFKGITASSERSETLSGADSVDLEANADQNLVRMREIERTYLKNEASLQGLSEMSELMTSFNATTASDNDYAKLTEGLGEISRNTLYEGESVISYLSTAVSDEKSLYTLSMNVEKEISGLTDSMKSEMSEMKTFLIAEENKSAASGFDAENLADTIARDLTLNVAENLHGALPNTQSLLVSETL